VRSVIARGLPKVRLVAGASLLSNLEDAATWQRLSNFGCLRNWEVKAALFECQGEFREITSEESSHEHRDVDSLRLLQMCNTQGHSALASLR
jgi:hypothetical protein